MSGLRARTGKKYSVRSQSRGKEFCVMIWTKSAFFILMLQLSGSAMRISVWPALWSEPVRSMDNFLCRFEQSPSFTLDVPFSPPCSLPSRVTETPRGKGTLLSYTQATLQPRSLCPLRQARPFPLQSSKRLLTPPGHGCCSCPLPS